MDQMILTGIESAPIDRIKSALIAEFDNPNHSQFLHVQENNDDSISIRAKTTLTIKVIPQKTKIIVEIPTKQIPIFTAVTTVINQSDFSERAKSNWSRFKVSCIDDVISLSKPLSAVFLSILSEQGGGSFACCSRYVECSDAKKCTNPNFMMALSCAYKKNLEAGRIFYGKNKTI